MRLYRRIAPVSVVLVLSACLLTGCMGGSSEEAATPVKADTSRPTSNQIPADAKARMEQSTAQNRAQADAQGKAMREGMSRQSSGK